MFFIIILFIVELLLVLELAVMSINSILKTLKDRCLSVNYFYMIAQLLINILFFYVL